MSANFSFDYFDVVNCRFHFKKKKTLNEEKRKRKKNIYIYIKKNGEKNTTAAGFEPIRINSDRFKVHRLTNVATPVSDNSQSI